jgi:hypothetical protein
MHRYIILCAFSVLIGMRLDAVTRRAPDGNTRRVWQTHEGLPENTVHLKGARKILENQMRN